MPSCGLCLELSYFLIARADEMMFAGSWGVVHSAYGLTRRDAAFFRGGRRLEYVLWRQAIESSITTAEIESDRQGDIKARARDMIHDPRSGGRAESDAVPLMVELHWRVIRRGLIAPRRHFSGRVVRRKT